MNKLRNVGMRERKRERERERERWYDKKDISR